MRFDQVSTWWFLATDGDSVMSRAARHLGTIVAAEASGFLPTTYKYKIVAL